MKKKRERKHRDSRGFLLWAEEYLKGAPTHEIEKELRQREGWKDLKNPYGVG